MASYCVITRRLGVMILLALLLLVVNQVQAVDSDDVDGFDDGNQATLTKRLVTDLSDSNLNPFQIEVFVSYCVA